MSAIAILVVWIMVYCGLDWLCMNHVDAEEKRIGQVDLSDGFFPPAPPATAEATAKLRSMFRGVLLLFMGLGVAFVALYATARKE